jgi:hypothetical protein
MEKVIENYEKAKERVNAAKEELWKAEEEIEKLDDGYIYVVCLLRYGSASWYTYTNPLSVQFLANDYYDGEDGLFHLYTNNPNAKPPEEQGSLRDFKIMTSEELKDMAKEEVSMGRAVANWVSKGM